MYLDKELVVKSNEDLRRAVKDVIERKLQGIRKLEAEIEECHNFISLVEQQGKMIDKLPTYAVEEFEES